MIVSIAQPAYLPWLGYFHRIAHSDLHVALDHVAISHGSFTNRNRVRTANGAVWLTVPVRARGEHAQRRIDEVEIAGDGRWRRKHWETVRTNYRRARFFDDYAAYWEAVYAREWHLLADLLRVTTAWFLDVMEITTPIVRSSQLAPTATKSELVLELCRATGATTYLSGPFGRDYLDLGAFEQAGIEVRFHDYEHPVYDQGGERFEPNLAALDAVFHCGPAAAELAREPLSAPTPRG